ncbi:sulfate permease [Malassezia pachydermatis]|uniref:Sulfate permease n=1 Tax=Malassezia pachydermatis TaxID=77020 RepID=A0A0M9VN36_9BASI|nr:sulfate permease [Malassezia pachydermatis]KOS12655.1 sulfate permease [Malassezia pachydermatis]
MWDRTKAFAKKVVRYDDTEANRLGVPMVGVNDFIEEHWTHPGRATLDYLDSLFPMRRWIMSYNLGWFSGDLIAGITVGLVLVPQSMSYAGVAGLAPEFGLYSSFVGVVIYALFATSKDVTIGPVAVMSLQTKAVIEKINAAVAPHQYPPELIASALAFMCGIVTLGVGLIRIGWLVEFIPAPAVSGFMTGSALTILVGQLPKLFGERNVNTNEAMYKVAISFFKNLPKTQLDVAFGLTALAFLYVVRWGCNQLGARYPKWARIAFFVSVMRSAIVIVIMLVVSRIWLGSYDPKKYPISLIKHVPRGFQHMGQPQLPTKVLTHIGPNLPASVILLLLEHIAIAKSFGRLNNYKINPNQELIAIGVTNLVGPCFGGYAATGSFSRSAIKSKSGVRSPLAGWITAIVVLIAIYALSGVFYWIPNAALAAVIIHAVGDLIAPPALLYKFWLMSPLELFIWVAAVVVTIFTSVDYGVYTAVAASVVLLLIRIARPRGHWLGVVRVEHHDHTIAGGAQQRNVFVPMDVKDGLRDPSVHIEPPPPGVFVYRVEESFTYPNASHMAELIGDKIKAQTRPGKARSTKRGDRPWNDPGPPSATLLRVWRGVSLYYLRHRGAPSVEEDLEQSALAEAHDSRPLLHALILDFGSVSNVDSTSVQVLVDLRNALERYAGKPVQFHFAHILSPWIRRGLLAGGFGTGRIHRHVTEIASVVQQGDARDVAERAREAEERREAQGDDHMHYGVGEKSGASGSPFDDLESQIPARETPAMGPEMDRMDFEIRHLDAMYAQDSKRHSSSTDQSIVVPIMWNNEMTPFFHLDLAAALSAATESKAGADAGHGDVKHHSVETVEHSDKAST